METTCDELFSGGEGGRLSKATAFLTNLNAKITGDELMKAKSIAEDLDSVAHNATKDLEVQIQELRKPFKALLSTSTGALALETSDFTAVSRKLQDLCPSSTPKQAAAPSHTPTPTVQGEATSIRGNLVVDVGSELEVRHNGVSLVAISVKGITPNAECNSQYFAPQRGQTVILDMEITTSPALAQDQFPQFTTITGWKAVTSDEVTVNGRIDNINCIASAERVPAQIGPSEKIIGKMAFDLPPGVGTLIWQPSGSIKGWEWNYGPS
ncbi:hypothetical protein J2T11_000157 [Paenarthrobacter nicotinovorans]|uniref:hypothetical protein n=1 Tax=Paenarthrobacter nicotinovorans TaxID=29320 RepID=UPI0027813CFC|nr:hypothetical protein [Paenarthrobacter nicotinovorans]MDP9933833.1 hypothetical protein [Paenarthrobacter nicotinovorans]